MGGDKTKFVLIPEYLWNQLQKSTDFTKQPGNPLSYFVKPDSEDFHNTTKSAQSRPEGTVRGVSETTKLLRTFFRNQLGKDFYKKQILDLILDSAKVKISNSQTIIVENLDTEIKVIDFINTVRSQKTISPLHETILKALDLPSSLITNKNVRQKQEGWISFSF